MEEKLGGGGRRVVKLESEKWEFLFSEVEI